MRQKINILIPSFLILFFYLNQGCSTLKKQSKDQQVQEIIFGKTGGFSNINNIYIIEKNGNVIRHANGKQETINVIEKKDLKKIEKELSNVEFVTMDLSEVGNITYYIEVKYSHLNKKITWVESTENEEIKSIYKILISHLNP